MRGCSQAANKSAACGAMEKRAADAEVTEPWFDGKETELADDPDYAKVLRLLGEEEPDDADLAFGEPFGELR